jgi:hypothetical protein
LWTTHQLPTYVLRNDELGFHHSIIPSLFG